MRADLPQAFETFGEARRNGFLKVKDFKENGGRVAGIFCTYTPVEILDAAGIMPVSLCGMSPETIPAAETELPRSLCPLIKSSYGFAITDKCPYTWFSDLIVGETTCDGKKKMYEMLGRRKETYILHLPQGHADSEASLLWWTAELHRFRTYLEEKFGVTITDDALRRAARTRNRERQARRQLMEVMLPSPPPVYGEQIYKTMDGAGFIFDREETIGLLDGLREQILETAAENGPAVPVSAKRILITGCPIGGVLGKTVGMIEKCGGVVVCFENCAGLKAALDAVDADAPDIMEAIAARYLKIGCAVMTPDSRRMELLPKLIREYRADGVIEVDLQACTPYAIESDSVRRSVEEAGVPYMRLETDYGDADQGQLQTRLEAFLEML